MQQAHLDFLRDVVPMPISLSAALKQRDERAARELAGEDDEPEEEAADAENADAKENDGDDDEDSVDADHTYDASVDAHGMDLEPDAHLNSSTALEASEHDLAMVEDDLASGDVTTLDLGHDDTSMDL